MDALTFSSSIVLKKLTSSGNDPVYEINLEKVLEKLQLTKSQFIDFCILSGCDYCETIPGVGAKTALKLIRKHLTIEEVVKHVKKVPENYLEKIIKVRTLFTDPLVTPADQVDITFGEIDREKIIEFLVVKKGFNKDRVNRVIDRIVAAKKAKKQLKIDSFFT